MKHTTCDRCSQPIPTEDARALDTLKREYPGMDICPACDAQIQMGAAVGRGATLNRQKPEEYLREWCEEYGIAVE